MLSGMAAISLQVAQTHLDTWLAAELEIAAGQSVSAFGRGLTRADLGTVREQVKYWSQMVDRLTVATGGSAVRRVQSVIVGG